jgi:hypothetical protein
MPDIGTGLAIAGLSPLITKVFGPTAEYMGAGLKNWVEKGKQNFNRIVDKAARKLGDKIEEPGAIPPRVLKELLQEGPFIEDEVAAEYFGGILASSRTEGGTDDTAVSLLAVIKAMSVPQIRLHYAIYLSMKRVLDGSNINVQDGKMIDRADIAIPNGELARLFNLEGDERFGVVCVHAVAGLLRSSLIGPGFSLGSPEHAMRTHHVTLPGPGLLVGASVFGVELFLSANGLGLTPVPSFLDSATAIEPWPDGPEIQGVVTVDSLKKKP